MTWLQILALAGVMGTFFGVGLALAAYFNGRHIKEGVSKISKHIKEGAEQTGKILSDMDQRAEKRHKQVVEIVTQQHKDVIQQHKDVVELLKKGFGERSNK